jgi:hypothetical protein
MTLSWTWSTQRHATCSAGEPFQYTFTPAIWKVFSEPMAQSLPSHRAPSLDPLPGLRR